MSAFKSKYAYRDFVKVVRSERRWVFEGKTKRFLDAVRAASKSRVTVVKTGKKLWRCQLGYTPRPMTTGEGLDEAEFEEAWPHPVSRMIPDPKWAKTGQRANPSGFVYLYLATRPETAMAEMRPWLGAWLSVSLFETQRSLKLVVCQEEAEDFAERHFGENPSPDKLDKYIWNDISKAFSRPVNRDDLESEYLPTQILSEVFKVEGFDGIAYRSSLAKGTNVVLFDIGEAEAIALAEELHVDHLLIDERKGRRLARQQGLPVVGLIGVVLMAKRERLIPSARALLERLDLEAGVYLTADLKDAALKAVGE